MALPKLSPSTLLAHIFSPKRHARPSGLRAVKLKGLQGGRKAGRLAAFNRMSPVKQAMLKEAGLRDAYLRGETTLAEAKASLRGKAVSLGVARPSRVSTLGTAPLDRDMLAQLWIDRLEATNNAYNPVAVVRNVDRMSPEQLRLLANTLKDVDAHFRIQGYARRDPNDYAQYADDRGYNVFWYR